jgi:GT2 family glycosyltransferase
MEYKNPNILSTVISYLRMASWWNVKLKKKGNQLVTFFMSKIIIIFSILAIYQYFQIHLLFSQ